MSKFDLSLYFLLNLPTPSPLELCKQAIEGGVTTIQLRGKDASSLELYQCAKELRHLTADHGVCFLINDRVDIALAVQADGVHLGKDDLPLSVAKAMAPELFIGISCYGSIQRAEQAVSQGADYVAFGSFYSSPSKPHAPTIPLSTLQDAAHILCPKVAIGGITDKQIPELFQHGADGVAVISAIQNKDFPAKAAKELKSVIMDSSAK